MNRLNTLTALCALLLSGFTLFAAESDLPVYRCGRFTGEITIDGKADEVAWSQADTTGALTFSVAHISNLRDVEKTIDQAAWGKLMQTHAPKGRAGAKLLWDSTALYLYFSAKNDQVWNYRSGRDIAGYYDENVFELFFDPDPEGESYEKNYVEINASPANDSSISDILNYGRLKSNYNFDFEGLEYAVHVEGTPCNSIILADCNQDVDTAWSLEMKLPFASMKGPLSLKARDAEMDSAFEAPATPPVLVKEDILNWDVLGSSLTDTETPIPGQMLELEMSAEDIGAIKSASTLTEDMKTVLLDALNGLIMNPLAFPSFSADITVSAEVETGNDGWNVYYKYPVLKNEPAKMDYTGTKPVLPYPLGDSATFIQQNATSRDTIFMAGCTVPDTIIERYRANLQRYQLPKLAKEKYDRLVRDSVFVNNTAAGTVSLAEGLSANDSAAIQWFNFYLSREALYPNVIRGPKEMLDTLTREITIADNSAFPPNDGDEWAMNMYHITSEPCSLLLVHYVWSDDPLDNFYADKGNLHNFQNYGTLRFVDNIVDAKTSVPVHTSTRMAVSAAGNGKNGVLKVRYSLPHDARTAMFSVLNAAGALVWEGTLANRSSGTHTVSIPGNLGSGAFVLRLEADGNVLTRKAFLVK